MKILKKRLMVVVMSLALFLTGIFAVGGIDSKKADAFSPNYNGDPYTIYYFTDYYPTVTYDELVNEFGSYNVVYDRQFITESEFTEMVYNGYFEGFDFGTCVVIIDIKTFMPDSYVLYDLFFDLQQNQGCITAFVSIYSDSEYYDSAFLEYVNVFVNDGELVRLKNFLYNSFYDLYYRDGTVDSTTYMIDGCLVDIYNLFGADMDTLCSTSPFLRVFLEQLILRLEGSYYSSYEEIADRLRDDHAIKLLVYNVYDGYFVDILTWNIYSYYDIDQIKSEGAATDFVCAFGFWSFNYNYYQILWNIQYGEGYDIPIYALAIDPVNYDPMGLNVITEWELGEEYGFEWYDEAAHSLLDGLHEWIG